MRGIHPFSSLPRQAQATFPRRCPTIITRSTTSGSRNIISSPSSSHVAVTIGIALVGATSFYHYSQTHVVKDRSTIRSDSAGDYDHAPRNVRVVGRMEYGDDKAKPKSEPKEHSYLPDWHALGERITSAVVPSWALTLPRLVEKLQSELSSAPGTLAEEMWQEAHDVEINPEIHRWATVRISTELCREEKQFLKKRKIHTITALAKYLDIPENEIHADDVPTIAMCGSGGGLRALVAGTSSYLSAQEAGLFDCVTYTAGVSGSCWLQTIYYSSIGGQKHNQIIEHLKRRIGTHIAYPPPVLKLLTSAPTNKYLLSGPLEKFRGIKDADFGIVDVYGLLLGARLLVPKGDLGINDRDLKISNQRDYVDGGKYPLPIYTCVRHEIPSVEKLDQDSAEVKEKARKESWFQWFEITPYEFWCEELEAGIPTWSLGREFRNGINVWRDSGMALPEIRVPLLMGIFGSAFCATLSHYYKEIKPLVVGLTGFGGLDSLITERDDDLVKVHPIEPAQMPNYVIGMKQHLPESCPKSLHESTHIQLMDAGVSNNLPLYPLLRPGRDVDILIAFDASADVKQDNWLRVADGYAKQRGIRGWPVGTGWRLSDEQQDPAKAGRGLDEASSLDAKEANKKLKQASIDHEETQKQKQQRLKNPKSRADGEGESGDLGFCTIWVGTTEERKTGEGPARSKCVDEDWELMGPNAGLAVIYFPFIPNPKVVGVNPQTSDFMSTWNFVYTPEQIDKVVELARSNFNEGREKTKMCVRAVYERKKQQRLEKARSEDQRWNVALLHE